MTGRINQIRGEWLDADGKLVVVRTGPQLAGRPKPDPVWTDNKAIAEWLRLPDEAVYGPEDDGA